MVAPVGGKARRHVSLTDLLDATALAQAVKTAGENDTESEHKARTAARHRRQTLVMPYISFAPRG